MGTILVKSALNALKIEVFKNIFFSLKNIILGAHFLKNLIFKALFY